MWPFLRIGHTHSWYMFTDIISQARPATRLFFFVFTAFTVFLTTMLLAFVLGYIFFGGNEFFENIQSLDYNLPSVISAQKFVQAFYTLGLFVFPPIAFAWWSKQPPKDFLYLTHKPNSRSVVYAAALMLAAIPIVNYTFALNQQFPFPEAIASYLQSMEENAARITEAFLADKSWSALLVNLVLIAVLPAIGEEFFFRGVMQNIFEKWFKNIHLAVFVTAIIFSALHLQFFGFLPRLILGMVLGYLFAWSRNLWLPILAHFTTNGFTVVVTHYTSFASAEKLEKINALENSTWQMAFFSTLLVAVLLYGVYQTEIKTKPQANQL